MNAPVGPACLEMAWVLYYAQQWCVIVNPIKKNNKPPAHHYYPQWRCRWQLFSTPTFLILSGLGICSLCLFASCSKVSSMFFSFNSTYLRHNENVTHSWYGLLFKTGVIVRTRACVDLHCSLLSVVWQSTVRLKIATIKRNNIINDNKDFVFRYRMSKIR